MFKKIAPLKYVAHAVGNLSHILVDYTSPDRGKLAWAYAWLQIKNLVLAKLLKKSKGPTRFLGIHAHFFEFWMFVFLIEEIFVHKEYAFECDRPDPVILDCGSNIGIATLYFKYRYPHAKITCFEPDPNTFAKLKQNVEANHLTNVELRNQAVWIQDTTLNFFVDSDTPGDMRASTDPKRAKDQGGEVQAVRLADLINGPVDFLKIDIEGAEGVVLKDLAETGKIKQIREMVIEYHHHIDPETDNLSEMLAMLEAQGFGYQIGADWIGRFPRRRFQDLLIYAYRKHPAAD